MERFEETTLTILAQAPDGDTLTDYDASHFLTYARLIDAEQAGTDWRKAASTILLCDIERDPEATQHCWRTHLARAHWVVNGQRGKVPGTTIDHG